MWMSLTEKMFLWLVGWRSSAAFHILYLKSGLEFEPRMEELIQGLEMRDLADLSPEQLEKVDELQLSQEGDIGGGGGRAGEGGDLWLCVTQPSSARPLLRPSRCRLAGKSLASHPAP
ncbi:hypothetical protein J5N97_008791 [Dioscorea zingiberensis]|uniref:DOG1 domain-containing protein n=1 Tax=Dioscorea zingiberensis TaxID=325984 RepID=A0A9D5HLC4_9LILI|nr:hypothetical protein J5N97_008791 [Dioscorea zingiberensis]